MCTHVTVKTKHHNCAATAVLLESAEDERWVAAERQRAQSPASSLPQVALLAAAARARLHAIPPRRRRVAASFQAPLLI